MRYVFLCRAASWLSAKSPHSLHTHLTHHRMAAAEPRAQEASAPVLSWFSFDLFHRFFVSVFSLYHKCIIFVSFCFSSLFALLWFWLLTLVEVFLYFYGWKKSWWSKPKRTLGNSSWRRRRKRKPQPKLTCAILSTSHIEALKSSDSQCF